MLTFQAISLFHWWSDGQCPSWFLEFCFHSCRYLGLTQFYTVVSDSVWFYLIFILTRSYIPVIFQVHMVSSYAWFLHNFIESGHHFVPPWKSDLRDRVFISIWFDYVFFLAMPFRCAVYANFTKPQNWRRYLWDLDPDNKDNNGLQNEDLIVWMRTAALPTFRKLYRRLDRDQPGFQSGLQAGNYSIHVTYSQSSFLLFCFVFVVGHFSCRKNGHQVASCRWFLPIERMKPNIVHHHHHHHHHHIYWCINERVVGRSTDGVSVNDVVIELVDASLDHLLCVCVCIRSVSGEVVRRPEAHHHLDDVAAGHQESLPGHRLHRRRLRRADARHRLPRHPHQIRQEVFVFFFILSVFFQFSVGFVERTRVSFWNNYRPVGFPAADWLRRVTNRR